MRYPSVFFALVVAVAGCAGQAAGPFVSTPAGGQRPAWQQHMDEARRHAAGGRNYALVGPSGIFVFYNNPRPFCYTYMIPGEWVAAREPNAYYSKDGRASVGVMFLLPHHLDGLEGANLVERASTSITRQLEEWLGQPVTGVELVPFEAARPGTWKWKVAPVRRGDRELRSPTKIIVDLGPDAVVQVTVAGTQDDDGLARRIVENLRRTSDPECYWPMLEATLKTILGDR